MNAVMFEAIYGLLYNLSWYCKNRILCYRFLRLEFVFQDEESIDFNNGVKQSAKIVFGEEPPKPKTRSLANEKDERYIEGGECKIEGRDTTASENYDTT